MCEFVQCLGMGIVPSKRRWERKMRARDRSVKFQGHAANNVDKVNFVFFCLFGLLTVTNQCGYSLLSRSYSNLH